MGPADQIDGAESDTKTLEDKTGTTESGATEAATEHQNAGKQRSFADKPLKDH